MQREKKYNMKLNLKKRVFSITCTKTLGFVISHRGIKIDLDKLKVINKMLVPNIEKEIKVDINVRTYF